MPRYRRIETWLDVVDVRDRPEDWQLDYKTKVDTAEWWEMAKDIAAFANHLGGVLLIGAHQKGRKVELPGIAADEAERYSLQYRNIARDKCSPSAIVSARIIGIPESQTGALLAVNVEPMPDQIVGAMFYRTNQNNEKKSSDAWRFFVRVGEDNKPIKPEHLAMYMNPAMRRKIIHLEAIPKNVQKRVIWRQSTNSWRDPPENLEVRTLDVDLEHNVVEIARDEGSVATRTRIPLDDVDAVWESAPDTWCIRVTGWFGQKGSYVSSPNVR